MRRLPYFALLALLGGCAVAPTQPPVVIAAEILSDLDGGMQQEASERFDRAAVDERNRRTLYPLIYHAASQRYEEGELKGAERVLLFLNDHYDKAAAPREALLYVLFLQRAAQETPDPQESSRMEALVTEIQSLSASPSIWVDLAATQIGIDQDKIRQAHSTYDRFLAGWSGDPPELEEYVMELGRYLESHGSSEEKIEHD
jgi:predicted Zn-dependent protease